MRHLRVFLAAAFVALIAIVSAKDAEAPPSEDDYKKELLKELIQESVVQQGLENPGSKVASLRYVTCDGTTWSCEDCNTRKFCLEFWWYTGVTYYQCPIWAPYCNPNSTFALCTTEGPPGCTETTTTSSSSSG